MSDHSARMNWPYPTENSDPWIDAFRAFVAATDASAFAAREDRNMVLMGGGSVSYASGVLAWTAQIELLSPITGFLSVVPAGNITLADGQLMRVSVTRGVGSNTNVSVAAANFAEGTDNSVVVAIRRGTKVYFRNGVSIANGDTISTVSPPISGGGGGGGGDFDGTATNLATPAQGDVIRWDDVAEEWVPSAAPHTEVLCGSHQIATTRGVEMVVGGFVIRTTSLDRLEFKALGYVTTTSSLQLQVRLYDLGTVGTPISPVIRKTISIAASVPTHATSTLIPGTDFITGTDRMYEVRIFLASGTDGDVATLYKAWMVHAPYGYIP